MFAVKKSLSLIHTEKFILYLKEMNAEAFYRNNEELCYHLIAQRMNSLKLNFDNVFKSRINLNQIDSDSLKNILINRLEISNENDRIGSLVNNISNIDHTIFLNPFRKKLENFGFVDETTQILIYFKQEIKKNRETMINFFDIIDKNKDKKISKSEFSIFFNFLDRTFTKDEIKKLFVRFDADDNNIIDLNEFLLSLDLNENPALIQEQPLNDAEVKKFLYDLQE